MPHNTCSFGLYEELPHGHRAWPTSYGAEALTCASPQQCQQVMGVLASQLLNMASKRLQQPKATEAWSRGRPSNRLQQASLRF